MNLAFREFTVAAAMPVERIELHDWATARFPVWGLGEPEASTWGGYGSYPAAPIAAAPIGLGRGLRLPSNGSSCVP